MDTSIFNYGLYSVVSSHWRERYYFELTCRIATLDPPCILSADPSHDRRKFSTALCYSGKIILLLWGGGEEGGEKKGTEKR